MSEWQSIETAPKYPETRGGWPPKIDILAKIWIAKDDHFEYRRFVDCSWDAGDSVDNRQPGWRGIEVGWRPVAWLRPEIPKEWPLRPAREDDAR